MSDEQNMDLTEEDDDDIITLQNDDGEEIEFYHIATLDMNEKWYILLQPLELLEGMEEDEVVIFELSTDEDGNDLFLTIEDEDTLNAVYDEYIKEAKAAGFMADGDDGCDCGCDGHHHHE